ncbi:adenosine deaminase [Paraferrimonas haliotis]|uniref:adenosine deaminase n=1 Tax=Paraferrimonas haliotis TaxID=2013866 RepID=UPI000BA9AE60|nr:adenosine deaminase [Paraferrimonas haliotis]
MKRFIQQLPKVELHLHIEGSLEPELMFELAKRNGISLPYASVEQLKQAYQFDSLQSFLDLYYQGAQVLLNEQDFFDLTMAYFKRCQANNVVHCEIMFDPQTHTARGVDFATVINGIHKAQQQALTQFNISSELIMCFLRHLDEADAINTLEQAQPFKPLIKAVGLDSSEMGHPPQKFERVFGLAKAQGYRLVAHAGEEGPAQNIWDSIDLLKVDRIDHGVRASDDERLMDYLQTQQIPLTVCPLSNTKLKVFEQMSEHNILFMLQKGICVTVNSDDPAYFGGYMNDNFEAIADALAMTRENLIQLSHNAVEASFASDERKHAIKQMILEVSPS